MASQGSLGETPFAPFTTAERIQQLGEIDEVGSKTFHSKDTVG